MRWFIVFLIVANVILFFWAQQQSRPLPGEAALPPPDVGRLRLLTEEEEAPAEVDVNEPGPAPGEALAMEPPVADVPQDQSESVGAEGSPPNGISLPDSESVSEVSPIADAPVINEVNGPLRAETEGVVLEAPSRMEEPAGPTLEGAAQTPVQGPDVLVPELRVEPAVVETAAVETVQAACARIGPLQTDDADRLISGLPATMTLLSDASEEYASVDRYYVLIPPLPSRAAGRQKLKELADAGIADTWLFPSGENRNAISLGFFSREAGAKRHAANVAKKGFTTEVKEKTSVRQGRWLLLKSNDGRDIGSSLTLPAGVAAEQRACP